MVDTVEQRTGISFGSRCNGDVGVSIGPADALRSDLVERARALIPQLQKNAPQAEVDRRIADENVRVITQSELFRIMVPRRFGGLETDIRTFLEVTRELARGCGSTAWAFSLINPCAWITALGSDRP
jgi:3-hydroxy-9,10-secoandrosta-1,3,5(10)-triene-9,17-dione monooxygenase